MSKDRPPVPPQSASGMAGGERRAAAPSAATGAASSAERKAAPVSSPPAETKAKAKPRAAAAGSGWGLLPRIAVSLLAAFHVLAAFTAPWYIQLRPILRPALPPGTVPRDAQGREIPLEQLDPQQFPPIQPVLPRALAYGLRHYTNLLYINNGYDFFSPDPSVSHIIRYEVFDQSAQKIAEGKLPDRRDHWPRLFYHRHMMLVEQSRDPAMEGRGWENAIARELLEKHEGDAIRLTMVRHHLLAPQQVMAGERLDAPATYEDLGVLEYRRPRAAAAPSEELPRGGS
ncbi:MAG: hypothetical protein DCC67_02675 [Planctomycetota bacterium]|nr:MAG: hypothetical protein DCC67_02675 [Planctomycetota bacterium]